MYYRVLRALRTSVGGSSSVVLHSRFRFLGRPAFESSFEMVSTRVDSDEVRCDVRSVRFEVNKDPSEGHSTAHSPIVDQFPIFLDPPLARLDRRLLPSSVLDSAEY